MKQIMRFILRIISFALIICLVIVLMPNITRLLEKLLPDIHTNTRLTTARISQEIRKMGELTSLELTDTGSFTASLPALIFGEAQRVTVPYEYSLSMGIDLSSIEFEAAQSTIRVLVPPAKVLRDELTVTGEPDVSDFFFPLTNERYQQILDEQAAGFKKAYEEDADLLQKAWHSAVEKLQKLLSSLAGQSGSSWEFIFEQLEEQNSV